MSAAYLETSRFAYYFTSDCRKSMYALGMSVDPSDRRLIQNEATQRLENSRVKNSLKPIIESSDKILFVCECSDLTCRDRIALSSDEFDEFHIKSKRFVVRPHHEIVAIEKIVSETSDYYIVEKHDDPLLLSNDYRL